MKRFDQFNVGDTARIVHVIVQKDIDKFVQLTGDDNQLHVNSDFARTTPFKKPVVHGMLSASFISTIIGTRIPGDGALWFSQNLEFLLPVRVGDEITVCAEIIKKNSNENTLELSTDVFNQHKQKVIAGKAKVKVLEREEETEDAPERTERPVALIVGATGGIGSAVALKLADEGYDILVHYNTNKEKAETLIREIETKGVKAYAVMGNVSEQEDVKQLKESVERYYEHLDVMVNCATAKIANIRFERLEYSDIEAHMDSNVRGAFNLVQAFLPMMGGKIQSHIIHMLSMAIEQPNTEWLHYITAKSALEGFSKALALELAPKNISVNMISPSMTETELIANIPQKARLLAAAKTPLQRLAAPADIAGGIAYLVSAKTTFITGETLRINGGQVML